MIHFFCQNCVFHFFFKTASSIIPDNLYLVNFWSKLCLKQNFAELMSPCRKSVWIFCFFSTRKIKTCWMSKYFKSSLCNFQILKTKVNEKCKLLECYRYSSIDKKSKNKNFRWYLFGTICLLLTCLRVFCWRKDIKSIRGLWLYFGPSLFFGPLRHISSVLSLNIT